jgi:4-amino-4-deoxychorismate lyase
VTAATVWINGERADSLSALDRGLHYGDGLFETLACVGGRPRFLSLHLARLALGCARLRLPAPAPQRLQAGIELAAAQAERSIVKLLVTRGIALGRGYAAGAEQGSWLVIRYPWPEEDPALARSGVRVRTAATRLGENPALAGLKHLNRLEQVLARNEDSVIEAEEALMLSQSGRLISGTMSNVFLVDGTGAGVRLRTPDLALCGVAGIMRRVVLQEAARAGIPVSECALTPADLDSAAEVFLTNARIGIWPVRALDGRALAPGPLTRGLQERLAPLLEGADA